VSLAATPAAGADKRSSPKGSEVRIVTIHGTAETAVKPASAPQWNDSYGA